MYRKPTSHIDPFPEGYCIRVEQSRLMNTGALHADRAWCTLGVGREGKPGIPVYHFALGNAPKGFLETSCRQYFI